MNMSYTWVLARKILLVFLALTILSSVAAFFVRNSITKKLEGLTKLTIHVDQGQSKLEQVLLLLHLAENDFQESLLSIDSRKSIDYKTKLTLAFNQIDTLLKENIDTAQLTIKQRDNIRVWYNKKLKLSQELLVSKHKFDSLLNFYSTFNTALNPNLQKPTIGNNNEAKEKITVKKVEAEKKGLFGRLKDAISNKNGSTTTEIHHTKNVNGVDQTAKKIFAEDKKAYLKKLQQLQEQNVKLLNMHRSLSALNTSINNQLEVIITDLKDINYHIADEFKSMAFKNYQETTALLNNFYLIALFLVLLFAILLIIFIIQLNKAELLLRKENEESINMAQQKIEELIKKIELSEDNRSPSKMEELKEVVQLAVSNNPAFLIKFNIYDPEFCKKLLVLAPTIVAAEIEFCALLRLNFETKEIARYTKMSVRAVEGKKYRIRRKLNIPSDQDINVWMTNI
jgi:hypothetical protein